MCVCVCVCCHISLRALAAMHVLHVISVFVCLCVPGSVLCVCVSVCMVFYAVCQCVCTQYVSDGGEGGCCSLPKP